MAERLYVSTYKTELSEKVPDVTVSVDTDSTFGKTIRIALGNNGETYIALTEQTAQVLQMKLSAALER